MPSTVRINTIASENEGIPITIGKIESGVAVVLTEEMDMMEIPTSLLPPLPHHHLPPHTPPTVRININPAVDLTASRLANHLSLQRQLRDEFAVTPDEEKIKSALQVVATTHTTALAQWPSWFELCSSLGDNCNIVSLRAIDAYLNGRRLNAEINERETSLRLTGLSPDTEYSLQLAFRSLGGRFLTDKVVFTTRSLDDFSCLRVTLDEGVPSNIIALLKELGITIDEQVDVAQTFLIISNRQRKDELINSDERSAQLVAISKEANIPLVTIEWVKASKEAGHMLSASQFYLQ